MSILSGPAIVITNVETATVFVAKRWSTASVSRVVRTARTTQEKHEKERAEHGYCSHIHDEVTVYDALTATVQGLVDGSEHPAENTIPEDDQEDETEQSVSDSLDEDKFRGFMKIWDTHQIARWYECYVSVEQSADSSWQPPGTGVVFVRHRSVQRVQS